MSKTKITHAKYGLNLVLEKYTAPKEMGRKVKGIAREPSTYKTMPEIE